MINVFKALMTFIVLAFFGTCMSALYCSEEDNAYSLTMWLQGERVVWNIHTNQEPRRYLLKIFGDGIILGNNIYIADGIDSAMLQLNDGEEYNYWQREYVDSVLVRRIQP